VNGVANSVRHVVDRLIDTGHDPLVIAPAPGPEEYRGIPVVRVRSLALPGYKSFPLGLPDLSIHDALVDFRPNVVHLASPIALGALGLRYARKLDIPTVAVYQTDIAGFARQYGIRADIAAARWIGRIHRRSTRNLVPSTASYRQLASMGVTDIYRWGRGVNFDLFDPSNRSQETHDAWTGPDGHQTVIGFVGRLAAEKQVDRLVELYDLPGTRLVVIGDGPERADLEREMPNAIFTGMRTGPDLARAFASLDVFVHTGEHETFCQTIQEAQASRVAVVAPRAGGPIDLIDHGRTGLLYNHQLPGSFRETVAGLVADPALRARIAAAGRAKVEGRTWASVVDELIEIHYPAAIVRHAVAA
jgi:phosphatidylinositol alpha 1,6-mannosyltransferase